MVELSLLTRCRWQALVAGIIAQLATVPLNMYFSKKYQSAQVCWSGWVIVFRLVLTVEHRTISWLPVTVSLQSSTKL